MWFTKILRLYVDPDRWLDEGEWTELQEEPLGEAERRLIEPSRDQRNPEIPPQPALKIQIVTENPEEIVVREGIYERILAEIHHEDKEADARVEEMLEVLPAWNEVQQEEDQWQAPDKWQRILQIVFLGGGLAINPVGYGSISGSFTQHQGGGCSVSVK